MQIYSSKWYQVVPRSEPVDSQLSRNQCQGHEGERLQLNHADIMRKYTLLVINILENAGQSWQSQNSKGHHCIKSPILDLQLHRCGSRGGFGALDPPALDHQIQLWTIAKIRSDAIYLNLSQSISGAPNPNPSVSTLSDTLTKFLDPCLEVDSSLQKNPGSAQLLHHFEAHGMANTDLMIITQFSSLVIVPGFARACHIHRILGHFSAWRKSHGPRCRWLFTQTLHTQIQSIEWSKTSCINNGSVANILSITV
jgi:hypothetical protein